MTNINNFKSEKTNKPLHDMRQDSGSRGTYEGHEDHRAERKFTQMQMARMEKAFATIAMAEEMQELEQPENLLAEDFDLAA